jgi:hypothetical protein
MPTTVRALSGGGAWAAVINRGTTMATFTVRLRHQDGTVSRSDQDGKDADEAVQAAWTCAETQHEMGRISAPVEFVGAREHRGW